MTRENPTILLTRPLAAARAFADQLADLGLEIMVAPVQTIRSCTFDIPKNIKGAIFTSRNAVDALDGLPVPCWCVGDATTRLARRKGWLAQSAGGDVEDLLKRILADRPEGPIVHFRGYFTRGNLCERLRAKGIQAQDVVVYEQRAQPLHETAKQLLLGQNPVILPVFSPRSSANLVQQGPFTAPLCVVAISDAAASEAVALNPARLIIAEAPNAASMVAAIKQVANRQ